MDKKQPQRFTLLEEDLVIWWDKNQQEWRVFEDKCPHRLAPLQKVV
ncbi:MAG UNVERIFIED_CONTAM: Rieske 2Fe-2S domain-containing protein [Microcystis novacekii LVE1205-3]